MTIFKPDIWVSCKWRRRAVTLLRIGRNRTWAPLAVLACFAGPAASPCVAEEPGEPGEARRPASDEDLRFWLENMLVYHKYSAAEAASATGLTEAEVTSAATRLGLGGERPIRDSQAPLLVLPYPGGRHPRIGFLDGAIDPQRETKVSAFTPWSDGGYAVVDVPEAIWWNGEKGRGLLYLAHTHVPTYWTEQGVELAPLEWSREENGVLTVERRLPNNVVFGASVQPERGSLRMELWIKNGTDKPLSGLLVQNCVMLAAAKGFSEQTNDNKVFREPYAACHDDTGKRWIITAWEACARSWGNAPCPCLHSDPQFPDCPPGEQRRLRGWLSFYEGDDLDAELARIEATGWRR